MQIQRVAAFCFSALQVRGRDDLRFDELDESHTYLTRIGTHVLGPYSGKQVVALLRSGELGPTDFVQDRSKSRWFKIGDTTELRRHNEPPAATGPSRAS